MARKRIQGISPVYLGVFYVIVVVLLYYVMTVNLKNIESTTRFDLLTKAINVFTVVLLIFTIYINVDNNNRIQEDAIRQNSYAISKNFYTDMMSQMKADFPESVFFFNEIEQMPIASPEELERTVKYDPIKRKMIENYYSNLILENIENWINLRGYLTTTEAGWLMNFYYQFKSPTLLKLWNEYKDEYDDATNNLIQDFIDISNIQKEKNLSDEQVLELIKKINVEKLTEEKKLGI